ncbi:Uncharacterised protein [uncultured archaeon]|nr:Uncharacterised protein [uncultured archaeon]
MGIPFPPRKPSASPMRKGFVALLDAITALFVLMMFSAMITNTLQQRILDPQAQLQRQGMDVLTALERSGAFYSPSAVLSETGDSVCMRLEIYNGTSTAVDSTSTKSGCPSSNSNERVVWRSFVANGQFKTARLAIWVKTQ